MHVPPWTILAGLGSLSRQELCEFLPHFDETTLSNIAADKVRDAISRVRQTQDARVETAFQHRLIESTLQLLASDASDASLRFRLWTQISAAFGIETSLPLSTRAGNKRASEIADAAATAFVAAMPTHHSDNASLVKKAWESVSARFSRKGPDFGELVVAQADIIAKGVASVAEKGKLSRDDRDELVRRVRAELESLPPELRTAATERALKAGDSALIALLASGSSLVGVGVAVNLAGFSAYILAAQAAALIPFAGGAAVVSSLFVLANPLFIGPAIAGGAYLASRHVHGAHANRLASKLSVQFALRGLSVGRDGLKTVIDDFRMLSPADLLPFSPAVRPIFAEKLDFIRSRLGSPLPPMPSATSGALAVKLDDDRLHAALFRKADGSIAEASTVGGLTAGDILFSAVAIDPTVLRAADFSRAEDLSSIFEFAAFSDRIGAMSANAADGAENGLRGYVAEQIVATRLVEKGHAVSFPATSNNPGSDLLVDGQPFQVKCLANIAGLREHFEKYPDIPVFANIELAEAVADAGEDWAESVFFVEGFGREAADFIMDTALEAGAALGDLHVPLFAVAVSTAKNLAGWWRGKIPLADLPFSVALDGTVKGGLATVGGVSGKLLGLVMFGPAGAVVLGGLAGTGALLGTHWTRQQATRLMSGEWLAEVNAASDRFERSLSTVIDTKIGLLRSKDALIQEQGREHGWFSSRLKDDIVSLVESNFELQKYVIKLAQPDRVVASLRLMDEAAVLPVALQQELAELLMAVKRQPSVAKAASAKAGQAWKALKGRATLPFGGSEQNDGRDR